MFLQLLKSRTVIALLAVAAVLFLWQTGVGMTRQSCSVDLASIPARNVRGNMTSQMTPVNICETIHAVIVCMGKCNGSMITPMLKSILHHRQNPIHFHFLVDGETQPGLQNLFDTWDLPDVNYTCYNCESLLHMYMRTGRWRTNTHYSGKYPFTKLLLPDILPQTLERVVVLDTDIIFRIDIAQLWQLFDQMTDDNVLGLAQEQSAYHLKKNRWSALGRGFNTGIILMKLKKMRTISWNNLCLTAEKKHSQIKMEASEQDVINAIMVENSNLMYIIPCYFNVQFSLKTLAKRLCYGDDVNNLKIIHWNNIKKIQIRVQDAEYVKSIYTAYANYDVMPSPPCESCKSSCSGGGKAGCGTSCTCGPNCPCGDGKPSGGKPCSQDVDKK